jgi:two-component system response regulator QseB
MRILLVEDDELLGDALKTGLIQLNYIVEWLKDGDQALLAIKNENFDLIILDLGLPKVMGMEVLKSIRNSHIKTPILILTAIDTIDDMVTALDSGADDYITKPFDLNELGARARALIRRTQGRAGSIIHYENITLDPAAHTVLVNGKKIDLARKEFLLLHKLLENTGKVLHRESLMQSIYGWDEDVESNALEVHIHNLRKKINVDFIKTIRGVGYIIEKQHSRG